MADIHHLPFAESSAIGIFFCIGTLEHVEDPGRAMDKRHRVFRNEVGFVMMRRQSVLSKSLKLARRVWYLLGTPIRRWPNLTDSIYLIEMPLAARFSIADLRVVKKRQWDEEVEQFARKRQAEDDQWRGLDYVSEAQEHLAVNDWCYLGYKGEQPVGIIFASRGPCYIKPVRYRLQLPPDVVGLYDVYTVPAFRGRGFYTFLFNAALKDCVAQGFRQAWEWIMPHNEISLRVHERLGLNHVFRKITIRQRWGVRWHRFEDLDMSVQALLTALSKSRIST